ncbi:angiopoietin-related protein 7-like [Phlebotomus argentipes]|uniref:angiopoietin-related protein 7-like n=1 Tax=Phlebotomus argentipes TaxID=94469 RepID=UPI002892BC7D|nr:angiopoietin-related protein 7-like [Phlebotomus argentipes]
MSKKYIVLFALVLSVKFLLGHQEIEKPTENDLARESEDLALIRITIQSMQNTIDNLNGIFMHNLEPKLMAIFTQGNNLDSNIKTLQEKTQNWHILQHHIDAWSDHMKAMDKKIDLLKQSQDNVPSFEKIIAEFDFKVNHIFEKVDILNEKMHEMLSILYHFKNPSMKSDPNLESIIKNLSRVENQIRTLERLVKQNVAYNPNKNVSHFPQEPPENVDIKEMKQILQHLKNLMKKVDNIANALGTLSRSISNEINDEKLTNEERNQSLKQLDEKLEDQISSIQSGFDRFEEILYKIQKIIEDNHADLKNSCKDKNITVSENDKAVNNEFRQAFKASCHELEVRKNGVYHFGLYDQPNDNGKLFNRRLCEFATTGPSWTVIQRRENFPINENFNRSWTDYKYGFGSLEGEFWFGNDFIHQLTNEEDQELRVELEDFDGNFVWAEYQTFYVGPEDSLYRLEINAYRGIVPDSLLYHNLQYFSTYDRDNDKSNANLIPCALSFGSGWWFRGCGESNLNGKYFKDPRIGKFTGILWEHWLGNYSLKSSKMLIRPRQQKWEDENVANKTNNSEEDP